MSTPQHQLFLLFGLAASTTNHVASFTISSVPAVHVPSQIQIQRRTRTRTRTTPKTSLHASPTESYLASLTPDFLTPAVTGLSATDAYLTGLSHIAASSSAFTFGSSSITTAASPEELLSEIAVQLAQAALSSPEDVTPFSASIEQVMDVLRSNMDMGVDTTTGAIYLADTTNAAQAMGLVNNNVDIDMAGTIAMADTTDTEQVMDIVRNNMNMGVDSAAVSMADTTSAEQVMGAISDNINMAGDAAQTNEPFSLLSQLSDLSYGSLLDAKTTSSTAINTAKAASSQASSYSSRPLRTVEMPHMPDMPAMPDMPKINLPNVNIDMSSLTSDLSNQMSKILQSASTTFSAAGKSASTTLTSVGKTASTNLASVGKSASTNLQSAGTSIIQHPVKTAESVAISVSNEKDLITRQTYSAVDSIQHASLSSLFEAVGNGVVAIGTIIYKILDAILDLTTGTTISGLTQQAQDFVKALIDNTIESMQYLMNDFASMTMAELAERLVAFITLVFSIVMAVLNIIVNVVSGKNVAEWALVAKESAQHSAHELSLSAQELSHSVSAVAYDVSHKELLDLTAMVGDFSKDVVASISVIGDVLGDASITTATSQFF